MSIVMIDPPSRSKVAAGPGPHRETYRTRVCTFEPAIPEMPSKQAQRVMLIRCVDWAGHVTLQAIRQKRQRGKL
jgi:hypothetical protein